MQTKKKIFITIFSIISILFGLLGAIFSLGGIFVLNSHEESIDNIHKLSLSAAGAIEKTAGMLKNSNEAAGHIAESIRTTKNTISYTSEISYDSGAAFNEVAGLVGFEILGFQPLGTAEEYFDDIGNNLTGLSEELSLAEDNLEINASDLDKIGRDLESMSIELGDVSNRFNQAINSFSIYNLALAIKCLLIYLGILNIIFILNGIMFLIIKE
ncbi:MAG: hypothetical protein K8S14_00730 [Actinomycetia bacterium]|nr:hypothetical protein [Actinomycetes bacterium]